MSQHHPAPEGVALYFRGLLDETVEADLEEHCSRCYACAELLRAEAIVEVAVYEGIESLPAATLKPVPLATRRTPRMTLGLVVAAAAGVVIYASNRHPVGASHARTGSSVDPRAASAQARHAVFDAVLSLAAAAQPIACSAPAVEIPVATSLPTLDPLPATWRQSGRVPGGTQEHYVMGVDPASEAEGHQGLAIFSKPNGPVTGDFASLGAREDATPYLGKRVRLTGFVKTEGVTDRAGLWLRVDGAAGPLALDNMHSRPICGTSDWKQYSVVLDVDPHATKLVYGSVLSGAGRLWADTPKLEIVDASVPVTAGFAFIKAAHTSGLEARWFISGNSPDLYLASADSTLHRSGDASLSLASKAVLPGASWGDGSKVPVVEVFGTAMQMFPADLHLGRKVRFSADVKTADVRQWAGLWLRVDGPDAGAKPLAFDNMGDRPLTGTTDWARYSVVLDVPSEAKVIALGVLLGGEGHVWVDDVVLEDADPAETR
jgi:hypothetical protein